MTWSAAQVSSRLPNTVLGYLYWSVRIDVADHPPFFAGNHMSHTKSIPALTLAGAKAMLAAAESEGLKNGWHVSIAIVDASGGLVAYSRLENTQPASDMIAINKARTAARFKRPSRVLEESVASGRHALLAVDGALPMQGGLPIVVDEHTIGAIGVSGVTAAQDEQVAHAGLAAFVR